MDLASLARQLTGQGDPLRLAADDALLPQELREFLGTMPNRQVTIHPGPNGIVLQGSTLTISGASADTWPVQGMGAIAVTLSGVRITIAQGGGTPVITGAADATLPFTPSAHAAVVVSSLDTEAHPWQIKLEREAGGVTTTELLLVGKGSKLPFDIPPGLDVLDRALKVEPNAFQITFYPNTTFDAYYTFALTAPQATWVVIADVFALDGIDISAVVTSNALSATLIGHLTIDKVGVDVGVGLNTGDDWTAFVRPSTGSSFPGVAALAAWIAGSKTPADTSGGFANLKLDAHGFDLALADVTVGFNCRTRSLNYLDIKSLLTIGGLPLDLVLRIPDLTLTGALHDAKPVKVVDMLAAFGLATTGVPGDLSITAVNFTADAKNSRYTAGMTIGDVWHEGAITLEDVSVYASYVKGAVSGTFSSTFALGPSTELDLSAAYEDGGWVFSGSTVPGASLDVGKVIADFSTKFGVVLPDVLHTFTLKQFGFEYNTSTSAVSGSFSVDFTVNDTPVELTVTAALQKVNEGESARVSAKVVIGTSEFVGVFASEKSQTLTLTWSDDKAPLDFADIARAFGYAMAPLPEGLDLTLAGAAFAYDFVAKSVVVSAQSKQRRQILLVSEVPAKPPDSPRLYLFELDVPLHFQLKDLPVIGDKLPPDLQFGIDDLQVIVASDKVPDLTTLNALIAAGGGKGTLIPTTLTKGLTFAAMLRAGSSTMPFVVPLSGDASQPPPSPPRPSSALVAAAAPGGNQPDYQAAAKWFAVDKTFGPVTLKRVGVQYEDSQILFLLDASLGFSALEIEMNGLGVGSPLSAIDLVPHLDGLSVTFSSGPVTIDGGLLRVPTADLPRTPPPHNVAFEYIGAVTIAVQPYLIGGMASYAKVGDRSSFFLFAQVTGEFGGPPAFFLTGFMGGFGFNSALRLPAADQIAAFPFLAGLDDPAVFGNDKPTPLDVMTALAGAGGKPAWVVPTADASWIAAGIRFRSFELVDGRALLIVTLGHQFAVALYGLARLRLPQGKTGEAYAYVELTIEAVFKPSEGFFGIDGSLTKNSFLLMRDCQLTGGFAFWTWFAAADPATLEHAGDFVVSVGGYHPAFVKPKWYPTLARVGFNWPVNTETTLKGGAYMALTPTAIMAGGNLEAVYQSGNLRAWFTADANLIIRWKPFYFMAGIGISLGASYRLTLGALSTTLSVELGASLELWGPPTGGIVHVHLWILSFSVRFGQDKKDAGALDLDWQGFRTLLPTAPAKDQAKPALMAAAGTGDQDVNSAILGITLNRGLIRTDEKTGTWIVRGDDFVFTTNSALPATTIALDGSAVDLRDSTRAGDPRTTIDIRPMNVSGVTSTHTITITKVGENGRWRGAWTPVVQRRNLPDALWGTPLGKDSPPPTAATVPNLPVGLMLTAPAAKEGPSPGVMSIAALVTPLDGGVMPLGPLPQMRADAARRVGTSANGLAPGQMQLFDDFTPGLDDGTYRIDVTQAVTAPGATIEPVFRLFTIAGPRFTLDPADIQSQFPPNGVSGQFDRVLPQIVLTRRRLPWERKIPGVDASSPWLALLVFEPGELLDFQVERAPVDPDPVATQAIANGARTLTVQQLLDTKAVRVPSIDSSSLSQEELHTKCQAIRISKETFAAIVPTASEMRALVHVRKVNTGAKLSAFLLRDTDTATPDSGTFSLVATNRFPAAGSGATGARNVVHLVSLEGFGDLIGDSPATPAEAQVQLVSLASWTFTCLADPAQTFAGLVETLARDGNQPRPGASLLLRVPSTGSEPPADRARLDAGYVQLAHHARDGSEGTTWFRGPLSPVAVTPVKHERPLMRAAEAVRVNAAATGGDDLSLASAWQIGRNLALADRAFATALMRMRKKAGGVLAKRMAAASPARDPFANVARLFAGGAATAILKASKSDQLQPIVRARAAASAARAADAAALRPAVQLRALAADPSFHAALIDDMQDDADATAVAQWIARLHTLTGVPFVHLVPDVRMLPPGSIRFFYVDPNWIAALADGALSLGLNTSHDVAIHTAMLGGLGRIAASVDAPTPTAGLLVRSPVVSGFPGLQVSGMSNDAHLDPLRLDHLGSDVLLCLFSVVPDTVRLARPQEGIDLGVDDNGQVTTRTVTNGVITNGAKATVFDPRTPGAPGNIVRPGGRRVLDLRRLMGVLHESAGAGSAQFTLQMLRGAEQIDFSRTKVNG